MEKSGAKHRILLGHLYIPSPWLRQSPPQALVKRWLVDEEYERIEGLRQPADRWRMLAGRFLLRYLIRLHYGIDFANFQYGQHNKPVVANPGEADRLDVNLTHDGGHITAAFSADWDVGVDIANLDQFADWYDLAHEYLVRGEIAWVKACDPQAQRIRAARLWTMKEAILKSTGHGLDIDPREIVLLPGSLEPIISLPTALPAKSSFRCHEWQSDQNTLSALVWVQRNPDVPREEIAEIQFEHIAVQQLYSGLYLTSGQNSD